jgi:hypothetical protein
VWWPFSPRASPSHRRSSHPPIPADLGVTYDLSDLMQQNQRIDDNRNETTSTWYDYYFGVCQDLGT